MLIQEKKFNQSLRYYIIHPIFTSFSFFCKRTAIKNCQTSKNSRWFGEGKVIDQFRYIKIQSNTIDLNTRLWGINPTNFVVTPQSLVLRSIARRYRCYASVNLDYEQSLFFLSPSNKMRENAHACD